MDQIERFISSLPKAELHLHIEGTFEPELMFEIAGRNGIRLPYKDITELKNAYSYNNLQEFLDIYYAGASVLLKEKDFFDLTMAYLRKIKSQNVVHTEIFFDPQTHTARGVDFSAVISGILRALEEGESGMGITSRLIMCFLRHLDQEDAFKTLKTAMPWKKHIIAVGLDSSERGHPPSKFRQVFEKAQEAGFMTVAHAGEEGPAVYVKESLELLKVIRVDHGYAAIDDPDLLEVLRDRQIALTMCPLSNQKLQVYPDLTLHPLKRMLDMGLCVTVNSDDPAYFGGYMNENYLAIASALNLSREDIARLAVNSFNSSFMSQEWKEARIREIHLLI